MRWITTVLILLSICFVANASDNPQAPTRDVAIDQINWDNFIFGRVKWWINQDTGK